MLFNETAFFIIPGDSFPGQSQGPIYQLLQLQAGDFVDATLGMTGNYQTEDGGWPNAYIITSDPETPSDFPQDQGVGPGLVTSGTFGILAGAGSYSPGDSIELSIVYLNSLPDPVPHLVRVDLTIINPYRLTAPPPPTQFTPEFKAKFQEDADTLNKLANVLSPLSAATNPNNPAAQVANKVSSEMANAMAPQVGTANAVIQTGVSIVANALQPAQGANPIAITLNLAASIDRLAAKGLGVLHADPPDGNYTAVYQAPDWSFGTIPGASAADNAFVMDSWKQLQNVADMLAASERYQGAELAGDTASQALQNSAFNTALGNYGMQQQTVANDLQALLPEIEANIPDINLANDTTLASVQAYIAGLANPLSDDPFLSNFIASINSNYPYMSADINNDVQQALTAVENEQPTALTGSAYAALSNAAVQIGAAFVTSVTPSQTTEADAGAAVKLTLTMSGAVTVTGSTITLTLNDGAMATYDANASNPASGVLVFDYTVGTNDHTANLQITNVNPNGTTVQDLNGNGADFASALNVGIGLQIGPLITPNAVTDLYITTTSTPLTVPAASGVLANDTDPNGLTLSATLDQTTAHGTLVLNPDGSFNYTPQAGFVGTDSFTYTASDAEVSSAPTTASIVVGSLNALTSPEQLLTELYVGYYDRAPDVPGLNYWLNNYNTPGTAYYQNLVPPAASFAVQTETVTLYPFLADPGAASYSDVVTFVDAAYGNLFNRTADTLGEEYWATSIAKSLGIAVPTFGIAGIDNDLPVTAANALLALINGAQLNDAQTIANKVTAGLYYYDMLAANNVAATQASAHAAFAGVTYDPATVLASEAVTNAFVQAALHPSGANAAVATVGILDSAQSFQAAA